jgi:hypothetical protein
MGEIEFVGAIKDFEGQSKKIRVKLKKLEDKVGVLAKNCIQYIDFASDDDER